MKKFWESLTEFIRGAAATNWIVAIFTVILGIVAVQQFKITKRQLSVQQIDERAWVEADLPEFRVEVPKVRDPSDTLPDGYVTTGSAIQYSMIVKNTGKTPARRVWMRTWVVAEPATQAVPLQCAEKGGNCAAIDSKWGILLPNEQHKLQAFRSDGRLKPVVALAQEQTDFENSKLYTALFGVITYQDVFGDWHWSHFCVWNGTSPSEIGATANFTTQNCMEFNDAGDMRASDAPPN